VLDFLSLLCYHLFALHFAVGSEISCYIYVLFLKRVLLRCLIQMGTYNNHGHNVRLLEAIIKAKRRIHCDYCVNFQIHVYGDRLCAKTLALGKQLHT